MDLSLRAGNHTDFNDLGKIQDVARAQIARFRQVCNVYAPLYRQITIGTYIFSSAAERERFSDVAYADVTAAFKNYLEHFDRGHKLVIIGHSQGAQLVTRLLHDTFDTSDALRARLLVGMPIGFDANVPDGGATVGGSFTTIPPCATEDQTGCVISYRSIAVGDKPTNAFPLPPGRRAICTPPGGEVSADGYTSLIGVAPSKSFPDLHLTTPYVLERGFYRARCQPDPKGHDYLEISEANAPGDQRKALVNLGKYHGGLGLHVLDLTLPQGNLIELIAKKAKAAP